MSAYNGRLRMKRWFGLPAVTVASGLAALPAAVLAILVAAPFLAALCGALACAAAAFGVFALALGEELAFVPVMLADRAERGNVTVEWAP